MSTLKSQEEDASLAELNEMPESGQIDVSKLGELQQADGKT